MKHNPNPPRRHADALHARAQATREAKAEEARQAAAQAAAATAGLPQPAGDVLGTVHLVDMEECP